VAFAAMRASRVDATLSLVTQERIKRVQLGNAP
jgi:hypothetical protein